MLVFSPTDEADLISGGIDVTKETYKKTRARELVGDRNFTIRKRGRADHAISNAVLFFFLAGGRSERPRKLAMKREKEENIVVGFVSSSPRPSFPVPRDEKKMTPPLFCFLLGRLASARPPLSGPAPAADWPA